MLVAAVLVEQTTRTMEEPALLVVLVVEVLVVTVAMTLLIPETPELLIQAVVVAELVVH